jgi:ubiquinone/menaquinone biosynthesis C-methylase UbiE
MEVDQLLSFLADGDSVLDIGCANGFSTLRYARDRRVKVLGLDYIPQMIEAARAEVARSSAGLRGSVSFDVGDILELEAYAGQFDKVVVVRVLINLGDWEKQQAALRQGARALKPGGMLLLSEATVQGWRRLNALRREWGLEDIAMPPFNNYLDVDAVVEAAGPDLKLVELRDFASSYYVATRVLKPLLARVAGAGIDVADPLSEWNRWASMLPVCGDYGTQKMFVFRKSDE